MSRQRPNTSYKETIVTISGGSIKASQTASTNQRRPREVLIVQVQSSVITFSNDDLRYATPQ
ncbi:hypothetical protein CR513_01712, partial [Mucuna pruriens]